MVSNVPKNLIYFIYFDGYINHYHRLNLEYLCKYWHLFDGQKIVKIAVNNNSCLPLVRLLPKDCKYEVVQNNPKLGESHHFLESLSRINNGITFYAHCKGVSRPKWKGLDMWIKTLYENNLEAIPDLTSKLFSGTCAKLVSCPPFVPQSFHYSGSFYWMDTIQVKKRKWFNDVDKYLTERFPAMIADKDECNFVFPYFQSNPNLYQEITWLMLKEKV
jgi:hypothetical protein